MDASGWLLYLSEVSIFCEEGFGLRIQIDKILLISRLFIYTFLKM